MGKTKTRKRMDAKTPELVEAIAFHADIPLVLARAALDGVCAAIREVLTTGGRVNLLGVGVFGSRRVGERAHGDASNGGGTLQVPAHRRVVFTPNRNLVEAVWFS
jgi:nucleoid DNA-binding protein